MFNSAGNRPGRLRTLSGGAGGGARTGGVERLQLRDTALRPTVNDGLALGTTTQSFSDLFLASGGVINFNNGNVTLTHVSGALAIGPNASGVAWTANFWYPTTSDGAALGSGTFMWSDLFLASGAVLNFNNGDITCTHSANLLTFAGADSGYTFRNAIDNAAAPVLTLEGARPTGAANDTLTITYKMNSSAGTARTAARQTVCMTTATDAAENSQIYWGVLRSGTYTDYMSLHGGASTLHPITNDTIALGTSSLMWSDLFLAHGAVLSFSSSSNLVTATHNGTTAVAWKTAAAFGAPIIIQSLDGTSGSWARFDLNHTAIANTFITYQTSDGICHWRNDGSYNFTWEHSGTARLTLTSTALTPGVSDAQALGTTSLMWSDLFVASGAVLNFNNGNVTLTHSAALLTLAGGGLKLAAGTTALAPLNYQSGTNLTTPAAGDGEFDGVNFYKTIDTTSSRGCVPVEQFFHLTANGSNISTIANFFGTTSNISLVASAYYEIEIVMFYVVNTGTQTVTWTLTNSAAPTSQNIYYEMSPVGGIVAPPGTATMLVGQIFNDATATKALTATGALTAANHYCRMRIQLKNGTGTSLKIQATSSANTITPGIGSFWTCRRMSPNNIGTFAA